MLQNIYSGLRSLSVSDLKTCSAQHCRCWALVFLSKWFQKMTFNQMLHIPSSVALRLWWVYCFFQLYIWKPCFDFDAPLFSSQPWERALVLNHVVLQQIVQIPRWWQQRSLAPSGISFGLLSVSLLWVIMGTFWHSWEVFAYVKISYVLEKKCNIILI